LQNLIFVIVSVCVNFDRGAFQEQIKKREANKKNKKMMKGRQFKVKAM